MYDTSAKSDWSSLTRKKLEGFVERNKLENIKTRIDKPGTKSPEADKYQNEKIFETKERDLLDRSPQGEGKRPTPNQLLQIVKDAQDQLKDDKRLNIRPEFYELRNKVIEDRSSAITQATKLLRPNTEEQFLNLFNRNHMNMIKQKTENKQAEKLETLFEDTEKKENKPSEPEFYDFKKMNNAKIQSKQQELLNRRFPNEIENIQRMKEKNYILESNSPIGNKSIEMPHTHPLLEKIPYEYEDIIESYSIVRDKNSKLEEIPFYRQLAPYARDVIIHTNESKARNNRLALELLDDDEFFIDENNVTYENLMNIISGRISAKRLGMMLNQLDYTEISDDEEEDFDDVGDLISIQKIPRLEDYAKQERKKFIEKAKRNVEYNPKENLKNPHLELSKSETKRSSKNLINQSNLSPKIERVNLLDTSGSFQRSAKRNSDNLSTEGRQQNLDTYPEFQETLETYENEYDIPYTPTKVADEPDEDRKVIKSIPLADRQNTEDSRRYNQSSSSHQNIEDSRRQIQTSSSRQIPKSPSKSQTDSVSFRQPLPPLDSGSYKQDYGSRAEAGSRGDFGSRQEANFKLETGSRDGNSSRMDPGSRADPISRLESGSRIEEKLSSKTSPAPQSLKQISHSSVGSSKPDSLKSQEKKFNLEKYSSPGKDEYQSSQVPKEYDTVHNISPLPDTESQETKLIELHSEKNPISQRSDIQETPELRKKIRSPKSNETSSFYEGPAESSHREALDRSYPEKFNMEPPSAKINASQQNSFAGNSQQNSYVGISQQNSYRSSEKPKSEMIVHESARSGLSIGLVSRTSQHHSVREEREDKDVTQSYREEKKHVDQEVQTSKPAIQISSGHQSGEDHIQKESVDVILKEIKDLNEAKENSMQLPKSLALKDLRSELNRRIEEKLTSLLYLIADDPDRKKNLKDNLGTVIRDINGLKGKVIDGHLKTQLLFQFLKEYKNLQDELGQEFSPPRINNYHDTGDTEFHSTKENNFKDPSIPKSKIKIADSPQKKVRYYEKIKQPVLQSQKLPAPQVSSHHLSHTQASLRRIQDVNKSLLQSKRSSQVEKQQKHAWIGNVSEDLSDDDDWIQLSK